MIPWGTIRGYINIYFTNIYSSILGFYLLIDILFLFRMSTEQEKAPEISSNEEKKPLKPCCACPETKQPRDACIIENGEENCTDLIEAHKKCMRDLGFKI